jgi:protein-glutamine gamma-glutamyltransferase
MVYVDGARADLVPLLNEYPRGSMERDILKDMDESSEVFRFDSQDELKFELTLRANTVNSARSLNSSGMDFSTFKESRCNLELWERKDNGGFLLLNGVSPASAIRDIFQNGRKYATECATAMVIVFYGALVRSYSDALFNSTFPRINLMNWIKLDPLLKGIGVPHKTPKLLLGDRGYFSNPDFDPETPEWQGENVIVLPNAMYYGHGIGITTADNIIKVLNENRKEGATQTAYQTDSAARPDYSELYKRYLAAPPVQTAASLVWQPFPAERRRVSAMR